MKSLIKESIHKILSIFNKEYLLEYWIVKKNEKQLLEKIDCFYRSFVFSGMKIIDVGANVGNYSQLFLNLGADVVGVEPQQYCADILRKRFKNESRFKLLQIASGAQASTSIIRKSSSHTIASMNTEWIEQVSNSNRFGQENWNNEEEVTITTLDTIINENFLPDYLKIDVEGYETEVLKGLTQPIQYISFELTLPEMKKNALDCINLVSALGSYDFIIPNKDKFSELNDWKSHNDIIAEIEQLAMNGTIISNDIFCKKK